MYRDTKRPAYGAGYHAGIVVFSHVSLPFGQSFHPSASTSMEPLSVILSLLKSSWRPGKMLNSTLSGTVSRSVSAGPAGGVRARRFGTSTPPSILPSTRR